MDAENKFGYFAKDIASELEVTTSTLRRWSIEMEKVSYSFERNEKEQRIYYERDFKAFRELKKLLGNSVSLTDAIKSVVSMDIENKNAQKTPSAHDDYMRLSKRELYEIIKEAVKEAVEEERELMFKAFDQKMNDAVERRDRILTHQLQKTLEEKNLEIATSQARKKMVENIFLKTYSHCSNYSTSSSFHLYQLLS